MTHLIGPSTTSPVANTRSGHRAAVHRLYGSGGITWVLRVTELSTDVVRYFGPFPDLTIARRWADQQMGIVGMEETHAGK